MEATSTIEHGRIATSAGPIELPIRYWDVSVAEFLFWVDIDAASTLLASMWVEPVAVRPGRALGGLAFYEYRRTSVGPYNEVGLAIASAPIERGMPASRAALEMLRPVRRRQLGFAVVDLPVTTETAHAAGREIWGYPKFVTDLPIQLTQGAFSGQILDPGDGSTIADLAGPLGRGLPMPLFDLVTYTRHQDTRWRTVVDVRGTFRACGGRHFELTIGPSRHSMAEHLRVLGLQGARPARVLISHNCRSLLHAGAAG